MVAEKQTMVEAMEQAMDKAMDKAAPTVAEVVSTTVPSLATNRQLSALGRAGAVPSSASDHRPVQPQPIQPDPTRPATAV